jgi:hypothetical protein
MVHRDGEKPEKGGGEELVIVDAVNDIPYQLPKQGLLPYRLPKQGLPCWHLLSFKLPLNRLFALYFILLRY